MLIYIQGYLKFLSTPEYNHSHENTHNLDNCHISKFCSFTSGKKMQIWGWESSDDIRGKRIKRTNPQF